MSENWDGFWPGWDAARPPDDDRSDEPEPEDDDQ
jgi:hypothetical protein